MADNRESIIIDVQLDASKVASQLGEATRALDSLKAQQKELNKDLKDGRITAEQYGRAIAENKAEQEQAARTIKSATAQMQALNIKQVDLTGTLDEQRQALNTLQKAYGSLTKEQKDAEVGGQSLTERIGKLSDSVKEQEGSIGQFQRNVGNYPKILSGAFGQAEGVLNKLGLSLNDFSGGVTKAFSTLGTSLKTFGKALLTPPIALVTIVLSAIVVAVQKVVEAFKKNDDAMTALQKAFAIFEPVGNAISAVFDKIALAIGKAAEKASQFITWISEKLSPAYAEAARSAQALVQAQDDLEEQERQYTVSSAQRQKEVSRLRAEAADKEKYTAAERRDLLKQAIDLEKQNLEEEKAIAAERLRILEETAKKNSDTSDETKNKIAEARAAMLHAEQSYYNGVRELQSQLTAFDKEAQQAAAQRAEENKRAAEQRTADEKRAAEERQKNAEDIARMSEDFAISIIEDETARTIAQRQIQGEREIAKLQNRLNTEKNMTAESRQQLAQLIKDKQAALDAELDKMATEAAEKKKADDLQAEQARAAELLEYKLQLAEEGSYAELELKQQQLDMQLQQALEATTLEEEEKKIIRDTFAAKRAKLDKQYWDGIKKQASDAKGAYKQSLMDMAKTASSTFGTMQSLLEQYGEDNEKAAAASKAFGMAKIITDQAISIANTGKALTEAVDGAATAAASTGPLAPFMLAGYIAAMVGAVLGAVGSVASSISQAKQLLSSAPAGKYAEGGFIPGNSYTGDRMIARVNSGEAVLTPQQQQNFMNLANTPSVGFDMNAFADVLVAAVAAQPAPVMDYSEFTSFQQKVSTYNEIARI